MIEFFERLQAVFNEHPEKTALAYSGDGSKLSYAELDEFSARTRAWLKKRGIGREDRVMILLERGCMIPAAMLGVFKNASACIVCEASMAPERVRYQLADSAVKAVIDANALEEIRALEPLFGFEDAGAHDAAYIVYTSGSTGNPKGVIHEFGNLDQIIHAMRFDGEYLFRSSDVFAFSSPLSFVAAYDFQLNAFARGAGVLIADPDSVRNPEKLIALYEAHGVSAAFMTPSLFRTLKRFNSQMQWMIIGGEPCVNISHDSIRLYNFYNMSEAGRVMLGFRIDRAYDVTPVGINRCGEEVLLLDEADLPVADGEIGEIAFKNEFVRGYVGLPERTAQSWRGGLFHTGDLAKRLPDGNVVLLGRNDDMIKINGNRIEPEEIASAAKRVLGLSWAAAKGFVTEERSFVVLYYTDEVRLDARSAREALSKQLTSYMLPSHFVKLDSIPLLPNGKLDKKSLPVPDIDLFRTEYAPPETELEEKLLAGFEKVLEAERLSVNDDFFELGGDSLRAIALIAELNEPALNAAMLYKFSTARRLAEALEQARSADADSAEKRDIKAREHDQPLIPIQYHLLDLQLTDPRSTFLNMPLFWRCPKEAVDEQRLIDAFKRLAGNHPALKSTLRCDDEAMFVMHCDPAMPLELSIERLSEAELDSIKDDLIVPFKPIGAPLYRFRVFETELNYYIFMDFNHIFSDGMSISVIMRNFSDAYHGRELPRDCSYLFLADANKRLSDADAARAHERNQAKYGSVDWTRNVTPDHPGTASRTASLSAPFPIGKDALAERLIERRLTLNSLAVAASLLALHEYERRDDIMVSWLYHGRERDEYQNAVVPAISELPVAVRFAVIRTLDELINEVRSQVRDGIRDLADPYVIKTTSLSNNDSFRVRNQGKMRNIIGIEGIPSEPVSILNKAAASSLMNLQLLEDERGENSLLLTYNERRYEKKSAERFLELLRSAIERLIGDELTQSCGRA
ncbi:MAG: AMP-binding protein [Clostridia bacterium]|nr:AMP-binding protein [Clostridia bacterium]